MPTMNHTTNTSSISTNFKAKDEFQASTFNELKSASTSSLTNNSVLSHNNSESRLNHSYQTNNHPLNSMQHQAHMRVMGAYDSASPSLSPMSSNNNNAHNYLDHQMDHHQQYHYQVAQHNRPNSSSSSSSSHNYSNQFNQPSDYRQPQYLSLQQQQQQQQQLQQQQLIQMKGNSRTTPSPTMLANSMVPLSLLSNNSADNVPISLPQRDNYQYYN